MVRGFVFLTLGQSLKHSATTSQVCWEQEKLKSAGEGVPGEDQVGRLYCNVKRMDGKKGGYVSLNVYPGVLKQQVH